MRWKKRMMKPCVGKLSLSQAAEMCGMKKWDFVEILINFGVNYLDPSVGADLDHA
jgi:hypothetical protein